MRFSFPDLMAPLHNLKCYAPGPALGVLHLGLGQNNNIVLMYLLLKDVFSTSAESE